MLYVFAVICAVIIVAALLWQIKHVLQSLKKANGTGWQRFLAAFSDSLTILWARSVAFVSALAAFAINLLPQLDPTTSIGQALQGVLNPKYVPYYLLGIMVVTEVVRRRGGSVDPILPPTHVNNPGSDAPRS